MLERSLLVRGAGDLEYGEEASSGYHAANALMPFFLLFASPGAALSR